MKKFRYAIEAALLWFAFFVFRCLPVDTASAFGGWIGRTIGPRLSASRKAYRNLNAAFPEKTEDQIQKIVTDMWDNLGRVIAEYPHLMYIVHHRLEVVDEEHVDALGEHNPCIIISSHLANWELGPFYYNHRKKWPIAGIYRAPNNPHVAKLLDRCRNPEPSGTYIAKSQQGVRDMIQVLKGGGRLGQLIDQKYNQGIPVVFFGRPAMTSPAFVQLAAKFDVPILPSRIERLEGCHFRIVFEPSFKTDGRTETDIIRHAHIMLEDWIRKNPGQWLWIHRRWDSADLKKND